MILKEPSHISRLGEEDEEEHEQATPKPELKAVDLKVLSTWGLISTGSPRNFTALVPPSTQPCGVLRGARVSVYWFNAMENKVQGVRVIGC